MSCPRLFEAEAMRDGRLIGAERATFERHITTCDACAREVDALEALVAPLRSTTDADDEEDELHVRRERTRLLGAFDHALVTPERTDEHRPAAWLIRGSVVVAAFALIAGLWLWRRPPPAIPSPTSSTTSPPPIVATVHADDATVWSKAFDGEREKLTLENGTLSIHVDHASGRRGGLVVFLPDGELEDTGTTFKVTAENGHTKRVSVEEGSVVLRLRDRASVIVRAGDVWMPLAAPVASPPTPSTTAAVAHPPDPSSDFRTAMAALDSGDNRGAATMFASFLARHPRDARAEDAAYLRVIALQRSGDDSAMKTAVQDYLRRYPSGFRHAEVEMLSK